MKLKTPLAACIAVLALAGVFRQYQRQFDVPTYSEPKVDVSWWRQAGFGMFIHFNPCSQTGYEISWSRGRETLAKDYDNLYRTFNPTNFDASEWISAEQSAGMKYLVFTTKHHDGFCNWDTKTTSYNIMHTPFGRDMVKELSDACHRAGMRLGIYYSQPDFRDSRCRLYYRLEDSPTSIYYWTSLYGLREPHARYLRQMHEQVRELLSNYGTVDILWFDAPTCLPNQWESPSLFTMIRSLQPNVVINDRCGYPAQYCAVENWVPPVEDLKRPEFETSIPLGTQWSWKPNDTLKTPDQCLALLSKARAIGGNLMLNIGPMPDGRIEPRQQQILEEIGKRLTSSSNVIDVAAVK